MTVRVNVGGFGFEGWTGVNVTRSVDDLAGTFDLTVCLDRELSDSLLMPELAEDTECSVDIFGQRVITGFIDKRSGSGGPENYTLSLSGRSKTRNAVDSSALHPTGQFNNKKTSDIVKEISDRLQVPVKNELTDDPVHPRFIFRDGEFAERAIRTCCREFGITATDDEMGNIVLKEIGKRSGEDAVVLGVNVHTWNVSRDVTNRYSNYVTKGQSVPTDQNYGKQASEIVKMSEDSGLKSFRPLIVHMDGDADNTKVEKRANMEATRRMGEGIEVSVVVAGWTQESGAIWEPDRLHYVDIPIEGITNTMLLKTVSFSLSNDEFETALTFVPPEAYKAAETGSKKSGAKAKTKTKSPSKQLSKIKPSSGSGGGLATGKITATPISQIGLNTEVGTGTATVGTPQ